MDLIQDVVSRLKWDPKMLSTHTWDDVLLFLEDPQGDPIRNCREFTRTGSCSFKERCKFSHHITLRHLQGIPDGQRRSSRSMSRVGDGAPLTLREFDVKSQGHLVVFVAVEGRLVFDREYPQVWSSFLREVEQRQRKGHGKGSALGLALLPEICVDKILVHLRPVDGIAAWFVSKAWREAFSGPMGWAVLWERERMYTRPPTLALTRSPESPTSNKDGVVERVADVIGHIGVSLACNWLGGKSKFKKCSFKSQIRAVHVNEDRKLITVVTKRDVQFYGFTFAKLSNELMPTAIKDDNFVDISTGHCFSISRDGDFQCLNTTDVDLTECGSLRKLCMGVQNGNFRSCKDGLACGDFLGEFSVLGMTCCSIGSTKVASIVVQSSQDGELSVLLVNLDSLLVFRIISVGLFEPIFHPINILVETFEPSHRDLFRMVINVMPTSVTVITSPRDSGDDENLGGVTVQTITEDINLDTMDNIEVSSDRFGATLVKANGNTKVVVFCKGLRCMRWFDIASSTLKVHKTGRLSNIEFRKPDNPIRYESRTSAITSVSTCPMRNIAVVGFNGGMVELWDTVQEQPIKSIVMDFATGMEHLLWGPNTLLFAGGSKTSDLWMTSKPRFLPQTQVAKTTSPRLTGSAKKAKSGRCPPDRSNREKKANLGRRSRRS